MGRVPSQAVAGRQAQLRRQARADLPRNAAGMEGFLQGVELGFGGVARVCALGISVDPQAVQADFAHFRRPQVCCPIV
jgi:hypothetical protein